MIDEAVKFINIHNHQYPQLYVRVSLRGKARVIN